VFYIQGCRDVIIHRDYLTQDSRERLLPFMRSNNCSVVPETR
jgi:hypothetical protein